MSSPGTTIPAVRFGFTRVASRTRSSKVATSRSRKFFPVAKAMNSSRSRKTSPAEEVLSSRVSKRGDPPLFLNPRFADQANETGIEMEITAGMVKSLRDKTDAPMMECKKALAEAAGNLEKAEELLRIRLGNKASKAASRVAAEGVVGVYVTADGKQGAMVELNCETDFVGKNDDFVAFAAQLAKATTDQSPSDVAALSS